MMPKWHSPMSFADSYSASDMRLDIRGNRTAGKERGGSNSSSKDDGGIFYKKYHGRVKSLKSDSFGFIECKELFDLFGRDVFVSPSQLKDCEVGADVTFGIFLNAKGQPQAKRIKAGFLGAGAPEEEADANRQTDHIFENAVCIICQEVLHRSTSVQPCLHSFCSACLGGWLRRGSAGPPGCPICRSVVRSVTRNHTLDGLINGLLQAHPNRMRPVADIQELDSRDILHQCNYDLDVLVSDPYLFEDMTDLSDTDLSVVSAQDDDDRNPHPDFLSGPLMQRLARGQYRHVNPQTGLQYRPPPWELAVQYHPEDEANIPLPRLGRTSPSPWENI